MGDQKTGESMLEGTASIGPDHPQTELERLLASRATPEKLVLLEQVKIGDKAENPEGVHMRFDQFLGDG